MKLTRWTVLTLTLVVIVPASLWAQTKGTIAGTVRDTSGAILPGVTVEASSPALIEKVRTVVTDASGQYKIIELPPGVFTVTFSLPGFSSLKREGIELTTGFTATVNGDLAVGSIEETVTVSGASPVVDVQNVVSQRVLTREVYDVIPSGKLTQNLAVFIPGMTATSQSTAVVQDVGGGAGNVAQVLSIHGSKQFDQSLQVEGMSVGTMSTSGSTSYFTVPSPAIEETNIAYAAKSAEHELGGVRINVIPKSGGNNFSGSAFLNGTSTRLQATNFTQELQNQGLAAPQALKRNVDAEIGFGGPVVKDRLWFMGSGLYKLNDFYIARFFDLVNDDYLFTPDPTQQGVNDTYDKAWAGRGTWQVTPKNKVMGSYEYFITCQCHHRIITGNLTPNDANKTLYTHYATQATWTLPLTNRLLWEAGYSHMYINECFCPDPNRPTVAPPAIDQDSGILLRSQTQANISKNFNGTWRASMSYVTGTHAFKVGFTYNYQSQATYNFQPPGNYSIRVLKGVPNQVTYRTTPNDVNPHIPRAGVFVQDQWTWDRLTLNYGVRGDFFRGYYKNTRLEGNAFLPAQNFDDGKAINWKDVNPRAGAAIDVFGNGKTAVKASIGRFDTQEAIGIVPTPISRLGTLTRTWTDTNRDFVPQGNPLNPAANGELGPSPNNNFGTQVFTTRYDPDWAFGHGKRGYNWEFSTGLSHQLVPRVGVEAAYFRRWFGNFYVTDNALVSPADYDTFCITAPLNSRLPNGGGQRICNLWDLKPAKVGLLDNVMTTSDKYGKQISHWNGFDVSVNARPGGGVLLQGGISTGKTVTDNCDVVTKLDNPSQLYRHTETPFLTQVKFIGSYRLPWDVDIAATVQSLPGFPLTANYTASNAQILTSLGRNLSAGATSNVTVNLLPPGQYYSERLQQMDFRLARTFKVGGTRVKGVFDLFNVFNANAIDLWSNTYGTDGFGWTPQQILPARIAKFELQVSF